MKTITLLTDFGLSDPYAGVMKGVIWRIAPDAHIADLTHLIAPQNVLDGALALGRAFAYFPEGSVHVAVVDPGVGTQRRPIAARLGDHYFVGPDNGLCTRLWQAAEAQGGAVQFVHLDRPEYWLAEISNVFHGRDIFSPVAAHLVNGVPLEALGSPNGDAVRLNIPQPQRTEYGWRGAILQVDHFGNIATNLSAEHLQPEERARICYGGTRVARRVRTFGEGAPDELIAMIDSSGQVSLCVNGGSAAQLFGASPETTVDVVFM